MSNKPINNWSQVISVLVKVQDIKQKNIVDGLRKISYRNQLQKQIKQHSKFLQKQKGQKQKQRQRVVHQSQQQKEQEIKKKLTKIKTEQWYQIQNLNLINGQRRKESRQMEEQTSKINQIEQEQKRRQAQTKRNFQLQNILNQKQIQIKNNLKNKQKQMSLLQKNLYDDYIQVRYKKQKTDRELWRKKYLYDRQIKQLGLHVSYNKAYNSFLEKQMQQKKEKSLNRQQLIDNKLRKMNQSINQPNSSPAYLGMITESFDRKKQLNSVDRHINFQPFELYKKQMQSKKQKSQSSLSQIRKGIKMETSLPQLKVQKQLASQSTQRLGNQRYLQTKLINQIPKKTRQFTSYDFITGTQKTFFI